jgi:hypothetical protein
MTKPYCPGTNCPLTGSCDRYKQQIDMKKEIHFSEVPYDHNREKCTYQISKGQEDNLSKRIKDLENGNQN